MQRMYFTEEHQLFRESLKEFLKKEVRRDGLFWSGHSRS